MDEEFEYKEEYAWLTNICLNVTDACNLACKYCFVQQHPHYMTLDTAIDAVNFILNNLEKKNNKFGTNERAGLTYFGGEPTLCWDSIIVPLTNYIRDNNLPIDLSMTTNGTLLNKERIQFMKDNNIFPLLSIDGVKTTQDCNRPCQDGTSSFDKVFPNIQPLLESFPNITFRATIDQNTANNTFENFIFATTMGFKGTFMMPNGREIWLPQNKIALYQELQKIYWYIEECFNKGNYPDINFAHFSRSLQRILDSDIMRLKGKFDKTATTHQVQRCGLGTTSGAIGFDGNIYGCQEQPSKDDKNIFYIGNLDTGIDINRHTKLLNKYFTKATTKCTSEWLCIDCPMANICNSQVCPSTNYDLTGDFYTQPEMACLYDIWNINFTLELMGRLVEANNQTFKKYLEEVENFPKDRSEC